MIWLCEYLSRIRCFWVETDSKGFLGATYSLIHRVTSQEAISDRYNRLKTTQSHQKSYADMRRRELNFDVGDWVFLKRSPMKGVMQFGKKRKLSPYYVGPYLILKSMGMLPMV